MTTFQYIIDGILNALSLVIPLSAATLGELEKNLLGWAPSSNELLLLVTFTGLLNFLFFFRYDWLGLTSGFFKSLIKPNTLAPSRRTLDQHTVLFLLIVTVPALIAQHFLTPFIHENEWLSHFGVYALGCFIVAGLFQFAPSWNKRIKGLNHLTLSDACLISFLCLFSVHPSIPLVAMLWAGFAITNHHYEAVFKFSMIVVGIQIFCHFFGLLSEVSFHTALSGVGYLNALAVLVTSFTTFWIALENLQKMDEGTFRLFKWINVLLALAVISVGVWKMLQAG